MLNMEPQQRTVPKDTGPVMKGAYDRLKDDLDRTLNRGSGDLTPYTDKERIYGSDLPTAPYSDQNPTIDPANHFVWKGMSEPAYRDGVATEKYRTDYLPNTVPDFSSISSSDPNAMQLLKQKIMELKQNGLSGDTPVDPNMAEQLYDIIQPKLMHRPLIRAATRPEGVR